MSGSLLLKYSRSSCWTFGMRVEPPTSTTSLISALLILASFSTRSTGSIVLRNSSMHRSSNFALVIDVKKSSPSKSDSTSMGACWLVDRVRLARSQAVLSLLTDLAFPEMSLPCFFLNSAMKYWTMRVSRSSPPRCELPAVARTSKTPPSRLSREQSKVPPPKSYTKMFSSWSAFSLPFFWKP